MKIALGQINSHLGAYAQNADKILEYSKQAQSQGASLIVFPEMALFGYPAYDLLERPQEVPAQLKILKKLIGQLPKNITVVFGAVAINAGKFGKPYQNVAVVMRRGQKPQVFAKQLLPSYDVFDDTRFFEPGDKTGIINIPGIGKAAVTVCEDMWSAFQNYKNNPLDKIKGVKLILNISASPFSLGKNKHRIAAASMHVKKIKAPFVYVNQVGGQDELIFDGGSFVLNAKSKVISQADFFKEQVLVVDLDKVEKIKNISESESLKEALVLGVRDFLKKTNQKKVHLGLSGGIDSALAACLAVDAIGKENVVGLLLPGPYSSPGSIIDSEILAKNLGIKTYQINIQEHYDLGMSIKDKLGIVTEKELESLAEQNLQSRSRASILMQYSNLTQSMLLSTANKSELATGYSTLYGDTCGGLMPLGDLTKNQVYAVAKLYKEIPQASHDKAPSAELAPNQKDQDSLPEYDVLDRAITKLIVEKKASVSEVEKWLENKIFISEFKRWQAPPILRVSAHSFGRGRRSPIARSRP